MNEENKEVVPEVRPPRVAGETILPAFAPEEEKPTPPPSKKKKEVK